MTSTANTIEITRNLIGIEDLLIGIGTVTQDRGESNPTTLTKINAANFPYDSNTTVKEKIDSLDTSIYVDENNIPIYILTPHDTAQLNLLDVIWIKDVSATERHVYYYDKIMFKYNPTSGNLIIDPSLFAATVTALTTAFQTADTTNYNTLVGIINNAVSLLQTADTTIYTAFAAADTALVTSLNLGTAASKNTGVGSGNVIVLNNDSKLPAVDGSLLTNLPTATLPSGAPIKKSLTENNTATLINSAGEHLISGSPPAISQGYSLFSISYTPINSGNKVHIRVVCPTRQSPGSSSSALVATILFIGGTFVKSVVSMVNGSMIVEYSYTTVSGSAFNIDVRIGILPAGGETGSYYINPTTYAADKMGATISLEEIKA